MEQGQGGVVQFVRFQSRWEHRIVQTLRDAEGDILTAKQLRIRCGMPNIASQESRGRLSAYLWRLCDKGYIVRVRHGQYRIAEGLRPFVYHPARRK